MKLRRPILAQLPLHKRAVAHAQLHRPALKVQAKMSFEFPRNVQLVGFAARRAQNAIASHLRAAVARTRARNNADKEDEIAGGAGMEPSPALPPRIDVEVSAHEKSPRG